MKHGMTILAEAGPSTWAVLAVLISALVALGGVLLRHLLLTLKDARSKIETLEDKSAEIRHHEVMSAITGVRVDVTRLDRDIKSVSQEVSEIKPRVERLEKRWGGEV